MDKTLSVRPRTAEVRGARGVVANVTFAHCTCPDQTWRDVNGKLHLCKHILHVYGRFTAQMRTGQRDFRVPSFTTQGVVYKVTVFHCDCDDFKPGVFEFCDDLDAAYEHAGFPQREDREIKDGKTRKVKTT